MISVTSLRRLFLLTAPDNPGLDEVSVREQLSAKSTARLTWRGVGEAVRRFLPGIRERMAITDDGDGAAAGWSQHGYLSAVHASGPERVWALDDDTPDAVLRTVTNSVLIDPTDPRYAVDAASGPVLGLLRTEASVAPVTGLITFAGSLRWGTANQTQFNFDPRTNRFNFIPGSVPLAGHQIVLLQENEGPAAGRWFTFDRSALLGPTGAGVYYWQASNGPAIAAAFRGGQRAIILQINTGATGYRADLRQVFTDSEDYSVLSSSLRPPATGIGAANAARFVDALPERGTADFSVAGWVRKSAALVSRRGVIVSHGADVSTTTGTAWRVFSNPTGTIRFDLLTPDGNTITNTTTVLAADTWYHFAAVRGPSGVSVYINGVLEGSGTESTRRDVSGGETITLGVDGAVLDDWAVWGRPLTSAEVGALYTARNGLSGLDAPAFLDASVPRAIAPLNPPDGPHAIGSGDLPWGGSVRLADTRFVPGLGPRSTGEDYSWAGWIRLHTLPVEDWDIRLPANDANVPVGMSPVTGRTRGASFVDPDVGLFVINSGARQVWDVSLGEATGPTDSILEGTLPATATNPGAACQHDGDVWFTAGSSLWRVPDIETPSGAVLAGTIGPATGYVMHSIESHDGTLYGIDDQRRLISINTDSPSTSTIVGTLPSGVGDGNGLASTPFGLLSMSSTGDMVRVSTDNPAASPSFTAGPPAGTFTGGLVRDITWWRSRLYITDQRGAQSRLWRSALVNNQVEQVGGARTLPAGVTEPGGIVGFNGDTRETARHNIAVSDGGTVTAVGIGADGSVVLTFTGVLMIAGRELVVVRAIGDGVQSGTFTADLDAAGALRTATTITWPAGTVDGAEFHTQVSQEGGGWSVLVVNAAERDFDRANLAWKPPGVNDIRLYSYANESQRPALQVSVRPSSAPAQVNLISGPVRVSDRTPLRLRYRGPVANRTTFYFGASQGIEVADDEAGLEIIRSDGAAVAVEQIAIGQGGGGMLSLDLTDPAARLDFNASLVIRCGSATVSAPLTPEADPPNVYHGPSPGAYQAITAELNRGNEVEAVVIQRDAAGVDTTTWNWGSPESVRLVVRLRGPELAPDDTEAVATWPHDGGWHLLSWTLTPGLLRAAVDGAGEVTARTRAAGSVWGATEPPSGPTDALKGRIIARPPAGAGSEGGVTGQMLAQHGTQAFTAADGTGTFYLHRLVLSYLAVGSPPAYRLAVSLSGTAGAVYSAVPDADVVGLTVILRIWRLGTNRTVAAVLAAADRQSTGNAAFVISIPATDFGDFDNQQPPDAVDIAIVDADHAGFQAGSVPAVRGVGQDLFNVDLTREQRVVSQFDTAAREQVSRSGALRLWHSETRSSQSEIASFGSILTPSGLTGSTSVWGVPLPFPPNAARPALRGAARGVGVQNASGIWVLIRGGEFVDPTGARNGIRTISLDPESTDYLRITLERALPAGEPANYSLLLRDSGGNVNHVVFGSRSREGEVEGGYVYRWRRPSGWGSPSLGGAWYAAIYDRTLAGWSDGPGASPPNYSIRFDFPDQYEIALLSINRGATPDWPSATGPNLILKLAEPTILPGAVLGGYRLFIRVPSSPEAVIAQSLSSPARNAEVGSLRVYGWNLTDDVLNRVLDAKALYGGLPWGVTMQDTGNADYRPDDRQVLVTTPLRDPVIGGHDVGGLTLVSEWNRYLPASEAARYAGLRGIGRVFTGRVPQSHREPLRGDYALDAEVELEDAAADLDTRMVTAPVSLTDGTTAREAVAAVLGAQGVRGAAVTTSGGGRLAVSGLPFTTDALDGDAAAVGLQDKAFDLDSVSKCLDAIAQDERLDGVWWVDRSGRLRLRRAGQVTHDADLSMREIVGSVSMSDNRSDLRTVQTVQGGPPADRVITDRLDGDGQARSFRLSSPVTSIVAVSVVRSAAEGTARTAAFSNDPADDVEWIINTESGLVTQSDSAPVLPVGGRVQVDYVSNHPIRFTEYDQDGIQRYGVIHQVYEDKSLLSAGEVRSEALSRLRRNSEITFAATARMVPGRGHYLSPGSGVRITDSDQVDGSVVRLVRGVSRMLLREGPGETRWKVSVDCIGAREQRGIRYSGRVPLTARQAARALTRLHVSSRSIARDTGILGVIVAASSPWDVGGDMGTWQSSSDWVDGLSTNRFPVDGRATRRQPHQLRVFGFVQASGTVLEVRLTADNVPVEQSVVRIVGTEPSFAILNGLLLPERVVDLRYQIRTAGTAGARVSLVQVVPGQEGFRDA